MKKEEKLVGVYTFSNLLEAQAIKTLLENNGIRAVIRSFEDSAYDGIYKFTMGAGRILIFKKDLERAKVLINKYLEENKVEKKDKELERWEKQLYKKSKNVVFIVFALVELFMVFLFYLGLRSILKENEIYAGIAIIAISIIFGVLIFLCWWGYKSKIYYN